MGYIGENIRSKRMSAGFDQGRLARELGLDQTAISRFENGSRRPSVEMLKKIAALLGCTFSSLVDDGKSDPQNAESKPHQNQNPARDFVQTLLAQNPQVGLQLRSLAEHQDELTPDDWQFLADHLALAFGHVERVLERTRGKGG